LLKQIAEKREHSTAPLPARFCVALLQLYRAFYYHLGPFHPRESLPGRGGLGVVCGSSASSLWHNTRLNISLSNYHPYRLNILFSVKQSQPSHWT